jgi:hypothetical protein
MLIDHAVLNSDKKDEDLNRQRIATSTNLMNGSAVERKEKKREQPTNTKVNAQEKKVSII